MKNKTKVVTSEILMSLFSKVYAAKIFTPSKLPHASETFISRVRWLIAIPLILVLGIISLVKIKKIEEKKNKVLIAVLFVIIAAIIIFIACLWKRTYIYIN